MKHPSILLFTYIFIQVSCPVECDRLKQHIYKSFPASSINWCFRRLNGTHVVGCTSEQDGNVGVLVYLDENTLAAQDREYTARDVESPTADGLFPLPAEFGPFIVIVDPKIWGPQLMTRLANSGHVNGVLLPGVKEGRWKGRLPKSYSDDRACPNSVSSFYNETSGKCGPSSTGWNKAAGGSEGLLWTDWDMPIFTIQDTNTAEDLYQCYVKYNQKGADNSSNDTSTPSSSEEVTWPLCAVELNSRMYAAKDSECCQRRSNFINTLTPQHYCDPLGDLNIYYTVYPRNGTLPDGRNRTTPDKSIILITARMDTATLFDHLEMGFDTPSTGVAALLTAAKLISQSLANTKQSQLNVDNIMFALIQGEAFDYIGSSMMVYQMENGVYPYNRTLLLQAGKLYTNGTKELMGIGSIKMIVELGQLSNAWTGTNQLYAHTNDKTNPEVREFVSQLQTNGLNIATSASKYLPPSSSLSFLKNQFDIPVIMVNNFDTEYVNPYYHSIYDNAEANKYNYTDGDSQPIVQHLAKISESLAKTVVGMVTKGGAAPPPPSGVVSDVSVAKTINQLLHCYTQSSNCTLYHEASEPNEFPWTGGFKNEAIPQYVGVHQAYYTLLTEQILQYFTGTIVPLDPPKKDSEEGEEDVDDDEPSLTSLKAECKAKNSMQNVYTYVFLVGAGCYNSSGIQCGQCYETTVDITQASSPAFLASIFEGYNWSSGQYPTWTESIWKTTSGRVFLKANPALDHWSLAIGIMVTVITFGATFALERKASVLFPKPMPIVPNPDPVSL